MRLYKARHGATKEPTEVMIDVDLMAAWYYSQASKTTHVVMIGGAMLPVLDSVEELTKAKTGDNDVRKQIRRTKAS